MTALKGSIADPVDRPLAVGQRWHVAQTIAKNEFRAAMQLEAQGFRVFLPNVVRAVRHARQTRDVRTAAFPGYVFVAFDVKRDRWRSINGTFGVGSLIMSRDGSPLPVPQGVVETLLEYLDLFGVCRFDRDLVVGQSVRIIAGPLAQTIGRLARLDARGRVQVLLQILGGETSVTIEKAALEAAAEEALASTRLPQASGGDVGTSRAKDAPV